MMTQLEPQAAGEEALSPEGQVILMTHSFARIPSNVFFAPLIAGPLTLYYAQHHDATAMAVWAVLFLCFAVFLLRRHRIFVRDKLQLNSAEILEKWMPFAQKISMFYGLFIAAPAVITLGNTTFDFQIFLLLVVAIVTINNATSETPRFGLFVRFFVAAWFVTMPTIYFNFPDRWFYVLPTSLAFGAAAFRKARVTHLFHVKQLVLEERSAQLAAQYKEAKEQAEEILASKNMFLITASHDLRQPVHAMAMLVEAISQRNLDPVMSPLLTDLKSSMNSMTMMFNSLLDLSKLEAGVVATRTSHVSLTLLLNDIVTLFREQSSQRGLTLRVHVPEQAAVRADPALLRQALVNLVHNALRYTAHGGLLIGVRQRSKTWQIEIWDTGVGIAEEDGPQIFSPYYRNQHAWRLNSEGHGLGLAVVARCARLMDAPLDFKSRLGKGSCFWLRLPMSQRADLAKPGPTDSTVKLDLPLPPLAGCCLVLDDDPQVIAAWKALFGAWGVTGQYAADGLQATQLLDAGFVPHAIFCDQRLRSGESGFEILKALLNRFPQACGAMVSGEFHSTELQDAENEGYLVLRKPLEPGQLHAVLSSWLRCDVPLAYLANHPKKNLPP